MELDDRVMLVTPEGVELALGLAGLGSRFIAGSIDLIIQGLVILILFLAAHAAGGGLLLALATVLAFVIWFFYNVLFEVLRAGRTPGKAATHLRVTLVSGAPVDSTASAIRNLMRVIDGLLLLYVPSLVSILVTSRNQRPGDLAAGTLVIRDTPAHALAEPPHSARSAPVGWDVSAVSADEVATVRHFLARRTTLDRDARRQLAVRLAAGLSEKVAGAPPGLEPERFLEQLVRAKTSGR